MHTLTYPESHRFNWLCLYVCVDRTTNLPVLTSLYVAGACTSLISFLTLYRNRAEYTTNAVTVMFSVATRAPRVQVRHDELWCTTYIVTVWIS